MIPDGLEAITVVRRFLAGPVLGAVPAELAGEVRAAVKLLDTVGTELTGLPAVLLDECHELLPLTGDGLKVLPGDRDDLGALERRLAADPRTLDDLTTLHRDVRRLTSSVVVELQSMERAGGERAPDARRALRPIYETLRRHAERRIPWQSVFSLKGTHR